MASRYQCQNASPSAAGSKWQIFWKREKIPQELFCFAQKANVPKPPTTTTVPTKEEAKKKHDIDVAMRNLLISNSNLISNDIKLAEVAVGSNEETVLKSTGTALQTTFDGLKTNPLLAGIVPSNELLRVIPMNLVMIYKTFANANNSIIQKDQEIASALINPEVPQSDIDALNSQRNTLVDIVTKAKADKEIELAKIKGKIILPSNFTIALNRISNDRASYKTTPVKAPKESASFNSLN